MSVQPVNRGSPTEIVPSDRPGYDWHNVMHMIMGLVSEDFYQVMAEKRPFDRADYVRRLNALPGDWPPPEEPGVQ